MENILKETPSQTAGPYVHIGCTPNHLGIGGIFPEDVGSTMIRGEVTGERIQLIGQIFDGQGAPVADGMIEAWQADADGNFVDAANADAPFTGFGRCAADAEGAVYRFDTVKPGRVRWGDGRLQAPHVSLWIVARGINVGLQTRAYFADEAEANDEDPILSVVPEDRRSTLIAVPEGDGVYRLDIRLQGDGETVFFDL